MNNLIFQDVVSTKFMGYVPKVNRVGKMVIDTLIESKTLYYELEWLDNNICLKKYVKGSLIPYESEQYTTDFKIKKVVICEFKQNVFSFCCVGLSKITHFNEKLGYTSRVLPFEIKDAYFIKDTLKGLLFIAEKSYLNKSYFWLTSSYNDLFPLNVYIDSKRFPLTKNKLFFGEFEGFTVIFYDLGKYFEVVHVTTTNLDIGLYESALSQNFDNISSFISQDLSYLNLSKYDQCKLMDVNIFNHSGVIYRDIDNNDFTINQSMRCGDSQFVKNPNISRILTLNENFVCIQKDKTCNISIQTSLKQNWRKSVIQTDFIGQKFLYIHQDQTVEIVPIENDCCPPITVYSITKFTVLSELLLVVLLDNDNDVLIYSGNSLIYTFSRVTDYPIFEISSRWDKIIFELENRLGIMKYFVLDHNYMIDSFLKFLKLGNPNEAKLFYDMFLAYLFDNNKTFKSLSHSFSDCICRYFGVEPISLPNFSLSITRIHNSLYNNVNKPIFNYEKVSQFLTNEQHVLYSYIYKFLNYFSQNYVFDTENRTCLETILQSIYLSYNSSDSNSYHSKENKIISNSGFIDDLGKAVPYSDYFSVTDYKIPKDSQLYNSLVNIAQSFQNYTIFPFKEIDPVITENRLAKSREILNWGHIFVDTCRSRDLFVHRLDDSLDDPNLPANEDTNISQKCYFSIMLNMILSRPIGLGIMEFGIGIKSFCDFSFQSLKNNICFEAKFMIYNEKEFSFPIVVKINENEIHPYNYEWARFHNGTCMAISSIRSRDVDNQSLEAPANAESWLKQAVDSLDVEESGGFIFGCGLIGQLYNLPVDSPGFLLNLLLKANKISISGILLGLGVSHIKAYKLDSTVLLRRLQRIFFIHSGLPSFKLDGTNSQGVSTVLDLFHFDNLDTKICVEAQAASLLSLGLLHFSSGDALILRTLKSYFNIILSKTSNLMPINTSVAGYITSPQLIYSCKVISLILGISIGLVNCKRRINNEFTWASYYGNLVKQLIDSDNIYSNLLESIYAMIGLTYLRSNDKDAAKLLETPLKWIVTTTMKPSLLILGNFWWGLIMENLVIPNYKYLYYGLDPIVRMSINTKSYIIKTSEKDVFYNSFAVVTGRLFTLCLKYAGTCNQKVYNILMRFIIKLKLITRHLIFSEVLQKQAQNCVYFNCLALLVLGLCVVFAGSCSTEIKLIVHKLRKFYKPKMFRYEMQNITSLNYYLSHVSGNYRYGFFLALNMALGFLCLGNGYLALTTSSLSSYCMLILSLYPNFPTSSTDNITYFQPLRHLYTLACTRSRIAILIDQNNIIPNYQMFDITINKGKSSKKKSTRYKSPCPVLLPYLFNSLVIEFPSREKIVLDGVKLLESRKKRLFDLGEWHRIYINPKIKDPLIQLVTSFPDYNSKSLLSVIKSPHILIFENFEISKTLTRAYTGRIPLRHIQIFINFILMKKLPGPIIGELIEYARLLIDQFLKVDQGKDNQKLSIIPQSNHYNLENIIDSLKLLLNYCR